MRKKREIKNLKGQKYNRLTILEFVGLNKFHQSLWKCKCNCGNEIIRTGNTIKTGMTKSCGCLNDEIRKIPKSLKTRKKMSISSSGEKNYLWKGGISGIRKLIEGSLNYRLWREAIFKRDNFTCQECGQIGGKLNADHIKPFAYFPELRFVIDNGRTLCVNCHKKTNTFAGRANIFRQELGLIK